VLVMTIGSVFALIFWQAMATADNGRGSGPIKGAPPQAIAYLNPFLAQVDVLCGTETTFGGWCQIENSLLQTQNPVVFQERAVPAPMPLIDPGFARDGVVVVPDVGVIGGDVAPFGVARDAFWPQSVIAWLVLSVVLLILTVQFVSPTRRWRLRRRRQPTDGPP
jgi:hypothetical protein